MRYTGTLTFGQKLAGFVRWQVISLVAMAAGAVIIFARVATADSWFSSLAKPQWTPPDEWILPIWGGMFVLMGLAVWLVWMQREEPMARLGVKFFLAQLLLSLIWVTVFFGVKNPGAGAIEIVVLWLVILATFSLFWQRSKLAGLLMFPCMAWATFASYLNIMIWRLNV